MSFARLSSHVTVLLALVPRSSSAAQRKRTAGERAWGRIIVRVRNFLVPGSACAYSVSYYRRIWPENWVDGGGLGITIRNEPRETVLTSIPISGRGVGNAAG